MCVNFKAGKIWLYQRVYPPWWGKRIEKKQGGGTCRMK